MMGMIAVVSGVVERRIASPMSAMPSASQHAMRCCRERGRAKGRERREGAQRASGEVIFFVAQQFNNDSFNLYTGMRL
jgi:hypothetical protein